MLNDSIATIKFEHLLINNILLVFILAGEAYG